jgi:hypothetical protein
MASKPKLEMCEHACSMGRSLKWLEEVERRRRGRVEPEPPSIEQDEEQAAAAMAALARK